MLLFIKFPISSVTIPEQLHLLQSLSGRSQTALAQTLGASFVSFNRWSRGKAVPRAATQTRIDRLLQQYTHLRAPPRDPLAAKRAVVLAKARRSPRVLQTIRKRSDLADEFVLRLTYTSNRIEGSTMTEAETAVVLFRNGTVPRRTLAEQLEAKNHQAALLQLFDVAGSPKTFTEEFLLRLHGILMNGTRDDAGFYRRHGVRILGANIPTANYVKVPTLMERLLADARKKDRDPIRQAAAIHSRFEQIHPFGDGNGRIGRLLIHAMLFRANLPPAIIRPERRSRYYAALNEAQRTGNTTKLEEVICDGILEGWRVVEGGG